MVKGDTLYVPMNGKKVDYTGKMIVSKGTNDLIKFKYKIDLPESMNREEFVNWFLEVGWKKIKGELNDKQWKDFSETVDSW